MLRVVDSLYDGLLHTRWQKRDSVHHPGTDGRKSIIDQRRRKVAKFHPLRFTWCTSPTIFHTSRSRPRHIPSDRLLISCKKSPFRLFPFRQNQYGKETLNLFAFIITFSSDFDSSRAMIPSMGRHSIWKLQERDLFRIVQIIQAGIVQRIFYLIDQNFHQPKTLPDTSVRNLRNLSGNRDSSVHTLKNFCGAFPWCDFQRGVIQRELVCFLSNWIFCTANQYWNSKHHVSDCFITLVFRYNSTWLLYNIASSPLRHTYCAYEKPRPDWFTQPSIQYPPALHRFSTAGCKDSFDRPDILHSRSSCNSPSATQIPTSPRVFIIL